MKKTLTALSIIGLLANTSVNAKTYEFSNGMQFDISGYLGWKQIISNQQFNSIPSQPEIGITTSLKITNTLTAFNQFKYGTSINDILVYNHIAYTPDIPIKDFQLTVRGGKIWYDWGLYNTTRVNPRTRQGVFQPQAIYWNSFDQSATSGTGGAVDIKYKHFTASYMVDKSTIVNPDKESKAWTLIDNAYGLRSNFGNHQLVSVGYEIPEYGLRSKSFWQTESLNTSIPGVPNGLFFGGDQLGTGLEWIYKDLTLSVEGFCTKPRQNSWSNFSKLYCAISPTAIYDITDNISVRANYNQYRTPFQLAPQVQTYSKDMNLGVGWHKGSWIANVEGHYIQGGRLVDANNVIDNPNGYKNFYVIGMNLVWFWN